MASRTAWVTPEMEGKKRLAPALRPFLGLARLAHAFAEHALRLRASSPLDQVTEVQARLLVQASNQLRILELAAERGYPLQALGAAATLYENVSALAYMHGDASKAAEWFRHTDSENTYPPAKKRATGIRFMLAATGVPAREVEALVATWEDHHTRFCAAKHGNPVLLKKYGVSRDERQLKLHLGPLSGPAYLLLSRMALYHGSRLLADASVLLATPSLNSKGVATRRFKAARRRILNRINQLATVRTLSTSADGSAA